MVKRTSTVKDCPEGFTGGKIPRRLRTRQSGEDGALARRPPAEVTEIQVPGVLGQDLADILNIPRPTACPRRSSSRIRRNFSSIRDLSRADSIRRRLKSHRSIQTWALS